jgi:acyl carrier protein
MEKDAKKIKKYLNLTRALLSQVLGTDAADIQPEDSLVEDLHMGPAEISDFIQLANDKGIDINENIFEEIETVQELTEHISENEEF